MLEVEQKFRVADLAAIAAALSARGVKLSEVHAQLDRYFNHPARDFAQTDEALRIRQNGDLNCVTYKGPKLDTTTKTRRELEVPIGPGAQAADEFAAVLIALGFRPVAEVRKHRVKATLESSGCTVEVVLDEVDGVGQYVELECLADEADLETAKQAIASLAAELGLIENERKSYLELLLEQH